MVFDLGHALEVEYAKASHSDVRIVLWSDTVSPSVEVSRASMCTSWR